MFPRSKTGLLRRLSYPRIPLNEPIPQFKDPSSHPSVDVSSKRATRVTQLSNGLRVASESTIGSFCTLKGKRDSICIGCFIHLACFTVHRVPLRQAISNGSIHIISDENDLKVTNIFGDIVTLILVLIH